MANLEVGTKKQLQTGTVTLQDISGNNLPDRILTKKTANQEEGRRGRRGSKNPQRFTSKSSKQSAHVHVTVVQ